MVCCMKVALNIEATLMKRLRVEAARRGTTIDALVEARLEHVLAAPDSGLRSVDGLPPLPTWRSGGHRVDIANRDELFRLLDED